MARRVFVHSRGFRSSLADEVGQARVAWPWPCARVRAQRLRGGPPPTPASGPGFRARRRVIGTLGLQCCFHPSQTCAAIPTRAAFCLNEPNSNHQGADVPQAVAIRRKPEAALAHQALPRAPRSICEAKKQTDHRKGREPFELGGTQLVGMQRCKSRKNDQCKCEPSGDLQQFGSKGLLNRFDDQSAILRAFGAFQVVQLPPGHVLLRCTITDLA
jgi:hypothetical protein